MSQSRPLPEIFEPDPATEEWALQEAEAEIAAGQGVSHEQVRRWLLSWGTTDELPPPPSRDTTDGLSPSPWRK